jgi:hypothetical protein
MSANYYVCALWPGALPSYMALQDGVTDGDERSRAGVVSIKNSVYPILYIYNFECFVERIPYMYAPAGAHQSPEINF